MRRILRACIALGALGVVALLLAPLWAPAQAVVWQPPPNAGLTGAFAPNQALAAINELPVGFAPEHVACDETGNLYTGIEGGAILRRGLDGTWQILGNTGGRPLGLRADNEGGVWVADSIKGILHVDAGGDITSLVTEHEGQRLKFVDDLDVDSSGNIWFSDASMRYDYRQVGLDFFEGSRTGRLLRYDAASQRTEVMLEGLFFANGVTLGPEEHYVLVNETGMGRVHRLWLEGAQAGESEVFVDALPGTPDNIRFDGVDTFWIALPALRNSIDLMASLPRVRALLSYLPLHWIEALAVPETFIAAVNLQGEVVHNLQDQNNPFHYITGVTPCADNLYLGSLKAHGIGVLPRP